MTQIVTQCKVKPQLNIEAKIFKYELGKARKLLNSQLQHNQVLVPHIQTNSLAQNPGPRLRSISSIYSSHKYDRTSDQQQPNITMRQKIDEMQKVYQESLNKSRQQIRSEIESISSLNKIHNNFVKWQTKSLKSNQFK
ncbi:Hypothetical_protein [Hexamita inflata]|uniref:Hypothetical_protein n=1 Tax=Hexamita inflata TaxID=28002 RepID=A0AA86U533_9EUKA|nr:Hypothetical protein HINF_LOCUS30660 [Hexamita inflata]CAI9950562.1 Hypothetical protein HINF_LOCUS38207 [Hexamita inflata]CAI9959531.1 Hypothetical protein HINF_LOCUS47176 [Hexamita inflata]